MKAENKKHGVWAVDVFCGAGGLTNGLKKAGVDVRVGIDNDPECEYPYTANNKVEFLLSDIKKLGVTNLLPYLKKGGYCLLAGCAPCQPFSRYNQKSNTSDTRWWLLRDFSRLVKELSPHLVTMENVAKLCKESVFTDFVKDLKYLGYFVNYQIVNCQDFGIPQSRTRLVLLASRLGEIRLLYPNKLKMKKQTVKDAIGKFPALVAGETCPADPLHRCSKLSNKNMARIRVSFPSGTWRDWPRHLVLNCHQKKSGKTYPSVYGRMSWDTPSPTITTQFYGYGNGRFGHPKQDRALSLREGAVIQGFPKSYKFFRQKHNINSRTAGRLIGNAVPIKLSEWIGKSLLAHVSQAY